MTPPLAREGLLACPFCGDAYPELRKDDGKFCIVCTSLDCYCAVGEGYDAHAMPNHSFYEEEAAIKAWNTRSGDDAQKALDPNAKGPDDCAEYLLLQARLKGQEQWTNIYAAQLGQFIGYGCEVRALAPPSTEQKRPDEFDRIADNQNFYDPREAEDYAAKLRAAAAPSAQSNSGGGR